MHRLFADQLQSATDASGQVLVAELGRLVRAAYEDKDRDKRRTVRSNQRREMLIERRDAALYQAKQAGCNRAIAAEG